MAIIREKGGQDLHIILHEKYSDDRLLAGGSALYFLCGRTGAETRPSGDRCVPRAIAGGNARVDAAAGLRGVTNHKHLTDANEAIRLISMKGAANP